jgi:hypothetical protein
MDTPIYRIALVSAAFVACFCLTSTAHAGGTAPPTNLSAYRDKNRVLVVFAPSVTDSRYKKQEALFRGNASGLKERDLVRFNVLGNPTTPLRKRYGVKSGEFRVILVGKDGHTAYSTGRPVVPSDLFRRIDRMPMRRDEIRQRGR